MIILGIALFWLWLTGVFLTYGFGLDRVFNRPDHLDWCVILFWPFAMPVIGVCAAFEK